MKTLSLKLLNLGFAFGVMAMASSVAASPQHGKPGGGYPRFEAKQKQFQEMRANRQAMRQARQQQKDADVQIPQNAPAQAPVPLASAVQQNQGSIERESNVRFNRLTPEERQALRRQIKEARREIYLQRQQ